ncbi:hypothetical protein [Streptomyces sp. NPDC055134]
MFGGQQRVHRVALAAAQLSQGAAEVGLESLKGANIRAWLLACGDSVGV